MAIRQAFLNELKWMFEDIRNQDQELQKEQENITRKLNEIENIRTGFAQAYARLQAYPSIESEDPCPFCWLTEGIARKMHPTEHHENDDEIFRCNHCDTEISIK